MPSASVVNLVGVPMSAAPWVVADGRWARVHLGGGELEAGLARKTTLDRMEQHAGENLNRAAQRDDAGARRELRDELVPSHVTESEPRLPKVERRFRFPGRRGVPDREALQGMLFVLYTGIAWRHLPLELGFGSGSTCYRRTVEWQEAGVRGRLHALLLAELHAAGELEWSRAVADCSHQAKKGAPRRGRARLIEPETAPSITFS
jgi:transposase